MKKFNVSWLPYMGAFVQAVLFGLAGFSYFELGLWGAGAGLGVGAVVNMSMAVASSRVSDIAKARKPLAYISLVSLFCLSPIIICSSLGWSVANLSWSLAADLSILLTGAIAGKSLVSQSEESKPKKVAGNDKNLAGKKKQVARKHVKDEELLAYLQANIGASQQMVADHFGVTRQAIGPRVKKLYEVKQ